MVVLSLFPEIFITENCSFPEIFVAENCSFPEIFIAECTIIEKQTCIFS